jgi:acyl transferase domain-containing protein
MGIHIPKEPTEITEKRYLLTFSASSADALRKVVQNHERYLEQKPESLADLSYTLNVRREPLAHRAFAVVEGQPKFEPFQVSQFTKSEEGREIAFVFTGQGAQWAQMGAELFESSAIFRNSIEKMEKTLRNCPNPPEWSLKRELLLPGKLSRISVAELSQPCCTAVQVALVDVLREWGIRPSSVVGHSSGEIAAAYASGAISAEEAILIAYYRGYVTTKITTNGKMAAIGLGREDVTPYLRPGVTIGCENSPGSTTLTGDADQLEVVMQSIKEAFPDTLVRALRVDCAYHSHHMQAVASAYASNLSPIRAKEPEVPFFSSVTGSKLSDTRLDGAYWVSNLVSPVLFLSAVSELVKESSPSKTLLEIGPHSALAGPVRQICKAVNATKVEHVGTLIRNQDANSALLTCAGNLFLRGHAIDFNAVTPKGRTLTDLPNYPWQREGHYWSESRLSQAWRQQKYPKHDILGARCAEASEFNPTWRNLLRLDDVPWIRDHNISEDTVFPGAGYVAMVGEAARQLTGSIDFTVREVNIMNALVLHEHQAHEVMTHLKPNKLTTSLDSAWYDFEISSRDGDRWTKHAIGQVRGGFKYEPPTANIAALGRKVGSEKWYSVMRRFGLNYGPRFQGLKAITADVLERKAVASLENTIEAGESVYAMHPSALDLVFQLYSVASSKGLSRLFNQLSVPTYIQELYIHPATEEITVQVETDTTPRGAFFGDAIGTVGGQTVLHLKNLRFSPLADASEARGADPHAAVELVWKPDIHFIDNASLMHVNKDVSGLSLLVERMALACMVESSAQLAGKTPHQSFLVKFQNWIDRMRDEALGGSYPNIHDCKWIAEMSSQERRDLIETIYKQTTATEAYGISTAVYRIYHACADLFDGKTDALEVLLQDDILTKVYDFGRVSDFREFFTLASHYKPNLKILEVGAGTGGTTSTILPYLSSEEGRHYFSYTYTDVSPGFFGSAKERFAKYEAVEYKVLDISKDPLEQGFEPNSFDLIVASNVIHATANLTETLTNVRKLLTPEGRFFLQELSPPTKWINFVMGTLPGWWLGEAEGRVDEPYLAPSKWEPYLREAGFDGIEAIHHDNQFNATMIAVPAKLSVASRVTLLVLDPERAVVKQVADILTKKGYTLDIHKWGELPPANQDAIALLDLEKPFLHEISEEQYMHFRSTTQHLKDAGILWVTGSAQVNCKDPRYGMILGTARTLRTELSLDLATFELDRFDAPALEAIATLLPEFQRRPKSFENKSALEWALSDGKIHIGRFHWISVNKQLASSASADTYAKRLDIEKRGFLNSLQWKPYKPAALEDDYVEVQNLAVGLNFKDVLISMGVVEGKILEGDGLGCESAGVVTKVGPKVKDLKPGDRCMVFASGAFSSSMTVREELCAKIPPTMSFAEAASMPTVYCTVIYSLCNVAHLEKGQVSSAICIPDACAYFRISRY